MVSNFILGLCFDADIIFLRLFISRYWYISTYMHIRLFLCIYTCSPSLKILNFFCVILLSIELEGNLNTVLFEVARFLMMHILKISTLTLNTKFADATTLVQLTNAWAYNKLQKGKYIFYHSTYVLVNSKFEYW